MQPLFAQLYQSRMMTMMMMMNVELSVESKLGTETEMIGQNQAQCYFVDNKFHKTVFGIAPRTQRNKTFD
jgi:hypothetical protein